MSGLAPALALPSGNAVLALPAPGHRRLRAILVLGGLALGLWLLGLLLGSSSAKAETTPPSTATLTQQLQRTTADVVGSVQQVTDAVTAQVVAPADRIVRDTTASTQRALTHVGEQVRQQVTAVVHSVPAPRPVTAPTTTASVRPVPAPTAAHRRVITHVHPAPPRFTVAPATPPSESTALVSHHTAHRVVGSRVAGTVRVARPTVPRPAPTTPTAPQAPSAPATPSSADSHELIAVVPTLPSISSAFVALPSADQVLVTGLQVQEPSVSPD